MHGEDIERPDTHLARDIQIKLVFIQICVFGQVKLVVLALVNFIVAEVLTRRHLLLSGNLNDSLLLLKNGLSFRIG